MKKPQYLKLQRYDTNEWAFNNPPQWEFLNHKLDRALKAEREGNLEKTTEMYLEIMESCPEYIPAINNLGIILWERDNFEGAIATFKTAVNAGLACIPAEFEPGKDLIPWHYEDNRAFLMAYENLGVCTFEHSISILNQLHDINPGYRGIRDLITKLNKVRGIEEDIVR